MYTRSTLVQWRKELLGEEEGLIQFKEMSTCIHGE